MARSRTRTKEELIKEIETAFEGVTLEDGIGLWEAQGHDDRLSPAECNKLRQDDEKHDWQNIPAVDIYKAQSSPSFFDAKGMRFHLPQFMLLQLGVFEEEVNEIMQNKSLRVMAPDIDFHLTWSLSKASSNSEIEKRMFHHKDSQFSALNKAQIQAVIHYLEFRQEEIRNQFIENNNKFGTSPDAVEYDEDYKRIKKVLPYWYNKLENAS